MLGKAPKQIVATGKHSKDFFNRKGELKAIRNLKFWSLEEVLVEKYKWSREDAEEMASFILPMLNWFPERRATPAQMLQHKWVLKVPPFMAPATTTGTAPPNSTPVQEEKKS